MKLLIVVSALKDIAPAINHFNAGLQPHTSLSYLYTTNMLHHQIDVLETGVGVYQTTYKLTKVLALQKYHLALKVGFGNSYKEDYEVGRILNIVNEKPGDYGMMLNNEWNDHYDFNLLNRESEPHVRGGFVNLTNAYMNVFLPFKKVVGVSVNHYANKGTYQLRKEKYKADCETGDGIGFVYPCLYEKQSFYQLCVIERCLVNDTEDFALATKVMCETLIDLVQKL